MKYLGTKDSVLTMRVLALLPRQPFTNETERLVCLLAHRERQDAAGVEAPDVLAVRVGGVPESCHAECDELALGFVPDGFVIRTNDDDDGREEIKKWMNV